MHSSMHLQQNLWPQLVMQDSLMRDMQMAHWKCSYSTATYIKQLW